MTQNNFQGNDLVNNLIKYAQESQTLEKQAFLGKALRLARVQLRRKLGRKAPAAEAILRLTAGGAAGWGAQDKYLDLVAQDISEEGRARANLKSLGLGSVLATAGIRKAPMSLTAKVLLGTGLGIRHGILQPTGHPDNPLWLPGVGYYLDPGKSKIPRWLAHVDTHGGAEGHRNFLLDPVGVLTRYFTNKAYDEVTGALDDSGAPKTKSQQELEKTIKEKFMPSTYSYLISALGGKPPEKPRLSDVGIAAAPHIAGGLGGSMLGGRFGSTLGNYFFPDRKTADYEIRKRQENRRKWLKFLGTGLGAIGGTALAIKAMPNLNSIVRNLNDPKKPSQPSDLDGMKADLDSMEADINSLAVASNLDSVENLGVKTASNRWSFLRKMFNPTGRTFKQLAGDAALQTFLGAGATATQYGLNIVPGSRFEEDGKKIDQVSSLPYLATLTAMNTLAARPFTRYLRYRGSGPATNPLDLARKIIRVPNARMANTALMSSGWLAGGPTLTHYGLSVPKIYNVIGSPFVGNNPSGLPNSLPSLFGSLFSSGIKDNPAIDRAKTVFKEELGEKDWPQDLAKATKSIFSGDNSLKKALKAIGIATAGQGIGATSGGVVGMVGGDWLADTAMNAAIHRGWIKKRKKRNRFVRDLGALAGAGLGAYIALKGMNYKMAPAPPAEPKAKNSESGPGSPAPPLDETTPLDTSENFSLQTDPAQAFG
jgi:hypothetical protein